MRSREVKRVLRALEGFEDTINGIQIEQMPIKSACKVAGRSVDAWGIVINEFNDVVVALKGEQGLENKVYRAAFAKALEIVSRAMGGVICES